MEDKDRVREFSTGGTTIGQIIPDCPRREFVTGLGLLPGTPASAAVLLQTSHRLYYQHQGEGSNKILQKFKQKSEEESLIRAFICSLFLILGTLAKGWD